MQAIEEQCYIVPEDEVSDDNAIRKRKDMADKMKDNKDPVAIQFISRKRDRECVDDTDCCTHKGFACLQRRDIKKCVRRPDTFMEDEQAIMNRLNSHMAPMINGIYTVDINIDIHRD